MRHRPALLLGSAALLAWSSGLAAQEIPATRASEPIEIDGVLDEAAWDGAASIATFTQLQPVAGAPASQRTVIRVLYDERMVYFGIEGRDTDPEAISRTVTQPAPAPAPEPPPKPAPPPVDAPPPVPDATAPKPAEEGAIFHALLDAGVEAKLAYTAEKRMHTTTSETVAAHTQPILEEVRDLAEKVRGLAGEVRDLTGKVRGLAVQVRDLAETGAERHRTLTADIQALKEAGAKRDRKLDVLSAQMRLVIGAFGLLITALIAVFGILFTR